MKAGRICWRGNYLALWEQATHHAKQDVQCAPVAMLGAAQRIHADALPMFPENVFASSAMMMTRAVARWNAGPHN